MQVKCYFLVITAEFMDKTTVVLSCDNALQILFCMWVILGNRCDIYADGFYLTCCLKAFSFINT